MMKLVIYVFTLGISFSLTHTLYAQDYQDPQNMPVEPENTDCQKLPAEFKNKDRALELIRNTRFYYEQNIKTTRRQGLMEAAYFSCDFKHGYLIVVIDSVNILHLEVPMELWENFQQTADIDGYYQQNLSQLPLIEDD